jgi:hypothetical protein
VEKYVDGRRFHFVYKTTCIVTGRYYLGMHSTDDLDDGYLGSGVWIRQSIKKHGRDQFHREIIEMCENRLALWKRETEIVNGGLFVDPLCMNFARGGQGVYTLGKPSAFKGLAWGRSANHAPLSPEHKSAVSKSLTGHVISEETREKIRKKLTGRKYGPRSPEWRAAISAGRRKRASHVL